MKKFLAFLIVLGAGAYAGWDYATKNKPEWFLKAITRVPIIDTTVNVSFHNKINWSERSLELDYFPHLHLVCGNEPSDLGDRVCWTYISKFNDLPAEQVAFFFREDQLAVIRVGYAPHFHHHVKDYLDTNFRYLGVSPGSKDKFGQELGIWYSPSGRLSAYVEEAMVGNESVLLWDKMPKPDAKAVPANSP
jgi:hypothetical protein